jgi:hypothetical protein
VCQIKKDDAYMFAVGDHLLAVDSDATPVDLGAIVTIDTTTYPHIAVITATNNVTTDIDVATFGFIAIQTQTSTPFTNAVGALVGGVDTGYGVNAKGGQGAIAISNFIAYLGMIPNYDSGALTDLGGVAVNNYMVVK